MDLPRLWPHLLFDQNFGMCITPQDLILPFYGMASPHYYRSWKWCTQTLEDSGSTKEDEKGNFKISLDVQHFQPAEISVKVTDNEIIITGKHEEKKDEHGFISRQFTRRYFLPKHCLSESVTSTLSSDGVLTIMAEKTKDIKEKVVLIKMNAKSSKDVEDNTIMSDTEKCLKEKITETDNAIKCARNKMTETDNAMKCMRDKMMATDTAIQCIKDKIIENDRAVNAKNCQVVLKDEHCCLLKPELLGKAVCGSDITEQVMEKREELDEMLKISDKISKISISATSEKSEEMQGESSTITMGGADLFSKAQSSMAAAAEMSMSSATTSMMSETIQETSSSKFESSMSSMKKATTSDRASEFLSEFISAELKEAAENM